jgi:hypothetical protein
MGRRHSASVNRHVNGERSSIGDFYVNEAVKLLDRCALIEMNIHAPTSFTRHTLTLMLFPDDKVEKLEAVRGWVDASRDIMNYPLTNGSNLYINWDGAKMPAPELCVMQVEPVRSVPLFENLHIMSLIRDKYAAVSHVLRWLNRNVTPAAVRALWPPVLTLCPQSPMCKEYADMPSRWTAPNDAGNYAALLRDTAGTVASTQLLPSDLEPRTRGNAWLTFSEQDVTREGITFHADLLTANL